MRVGVALSGGGAKGAAHVGVLRALEEAGIQINCISGTGSGSIIAALYAAGYSTEEMENVFTQFAKKEKGNQCKMKDGCKTCSYPVKIRKVKKLIDFNYFGVLGCLLNFLFFRTNHCRGLVKGELLRKNLAELLAHKGCHSMQDFKIPIAVPALDLKSMQTVYFSNKTFYSDVMSHTFAADAVTASCAFPGVFRPKQIGKYYLVGGGLVDNLPVEVLSLLGADYSIGVQLSDIENFDMKVNNNIIHILERSVNILIYKYANLTDWASDYTINTHIDHVSLLDLGEMCRCIELGYRAAKQELIKNPPLKLALQTRK